MINTNNLFLTFINTKNIIFVLMLCCLSCKEKDLYPNAKTSIGSIDAIANGKKWPDRGSVFQVGINKYVLDTLKLPCPNTILITIGSYSFPQGYGVASLVFTINKKLGEFVINQNFDSHRGITDLTKIDCTGLPNCSDINYNDIDANAASYVTDLTQKNTIIISEITDKTITGKFELFYKKGIGGNLDDYPNSLHIVCSKFVAVR